MRYRDLQKIYMFGPSDDQNIFLTHMCPPSTIPSSLLPQILGRSILSDKTNGRGFVITFGVLSSVPAKLPEA